MQTIVEIPDELALKLADLARREDRSEGAVVSAALQLYFERNPSKDSDPAFGLWKDRGVDGLAAQEQLREEWPAHESDL